MKLELRRIEYLARNSEETACYVAQVWVDGKHVADVSNDGHGGCDRQNPANGYTYKDIDALNERCKAEFPPLALGEGKTIPADLDLVCGRKLDEWLEAKAVNLQLRRLLRTKAMFTTASMPGIRSIPLKQKGRLYSLGVIVEHIRKLYPDARVLNNLPYDEALAIFDKEGRK